jgi:hypothetical protein
MLDVVEGFVKFALASEHGVVVSHGRYAGNVRFMLMLSNSIQYVVGDLAYFGAALPKLMNH